MNAVVVLGVVVALLIGVLAVELSQAAKERQAWAEERRVLVDRVIARHSGEVVALDRAAAPREPREPYEPPHIVGLS